MDTEKKEVHKKTYIIEEIHYSNGSVNLNRSNQGFSVTELLGLTTMVQLDLMEILKSSVRNHDEINRDSKDSPLCKPLHEIVKPLHRKSQLPELGEYIVCDRRIQHTEKCLTSGKQYKVVDINDYRFFVIDDNNNKKGYELNTFHRRWKFLN